jgi:hypothetical protein
LKLNISYLREFSMLVWTLLQGQKVQRKLLPKSIQCIYVRHNNGLRSIKFYNLQMQKILLSWNFCFLSSPLEESLPEEITIAPDATHKGRVG